ncbi:MAG: 16S rRNA (adenine(1518)-N(6)/adenine(1519)-N(6))-dimethyltransferase RsmA, partial [Candidatus Peregrinibacteria bacterium]|nr:16S rRNA (adenine(1518)-N(6)/adenine(1519)-N(6))-dimethyltransferase RsmA [Candidatus Peregrinibacteria bacterium]
MTIKAKKSLGQNFLHHCGSLNKIVKAANIQPTDHIIEIGPGHGVLTEELLKRAKHVTAVELDDRLIPELNEKFGSLKNFTLIQGDALEFTPPKTPYKLVANIPYYITSPILNHFLREQPSNQRPTQLTLLIQKEVAQKICAQVGDLNVLAIQAQLFGTPKNIAKVPPSHFKPMPKVDSTILNITIYGKPIIEQTDIGNFFKMIHAGFGHRRKKLLKNLGPLGIKL